MSHGLMYVREWMMKSVKMRWYLEVELPTCSYVLGILRVS